MYSGWQCALSLQLVFDTVLDQSMMQKFKRMIEEEEEMMTGWINTEVLEGWELLVKKGDDAMWYCDGLTEDECVFVVEHAIAHFGYRIGTMAMQLQTMWLGTCIRVL
jgi:predicted SAM-dependent methyltransferase